MLLQFHNFLPAFFGAFFLSSICLCEEKVALFSLVAFFFGGVCVLFAAAAVVVAVLKKINFTSISRDGRDFSICCAFFSLFFCHL